MVDAELIHAFLEHLQLNMPGEPPPPSPLPPPSPSTPVEVFRFLDLPCKLRIKIYKMALVVGPPINLCTSVHRGKLPGKDNMPNVALLKTNRQIHDEAAPALYSKNMFILPHRIPLNYALYSKAHLFRFVTVNFGRTSGFASVHSHCNCSPFFGIWFDPNEGVQLEPRKVCKWKSTLMANDTWRSQVAFLQLLTLDGLQIDLSACYCPSGCCRVFHHVLQAVTAAKLSPNPIFRYGDAPFDTKFVEFGPDRETPSLVVKKWILIGSPHDRFEALELVDALAPIYGQEENDLSEAHAAHAYMVNHLTSYTDLAPHPDWTPLGRSMIPRF